MTIAKDVMQNKLPFTSEEEIRRGWITDDQEWVTVQEWVTTLEWVTKYRELAAECWKQESDNRPDCSEIIVKLNNVSSSSQPSSQPAELA